MWCLFVCVCVCDDVCVSVCVVCMCIQRTTMNDDDEKIHSIFCLFVCVCFVVVLSSL